MKETQRFHGFFSLVQKTSFDSDLFPNVTRKHNPAQSSAPPPHPNTQICRLYSKLNPWTDSCQTVEFGASGRAVPLGLQQLWSYSCYMISLLGRSDTLSTACTHPPPECAALPFSKHLNASLWRVHYVLFIRSGGNKWIPNNQLSVLSVKSPIPHRDITATLESFPLEHAPLFFIIWCFTEVLRCLLFGLGRQRFPPR